MCHLLTGGFGIGQGITKALLSQELRGVPVDVGVNSWLRRGGLLVDRSGLHALGFLVAEHGRARLATFNDW